ncbi:MAG: Ig-like domain-containing protein [Lachnospiraceae bacterium]
MKRGITFVVVAVLSASNLPVISSAKAAKPTVMEKKIVLYVNGDAASAKQKITLKKNKGYQVTYRSADKTVVTVTKKGVVKAKSKGKTKVTVTFQKGSVTVKRKVTVRVKKYKADCVLTAAQTGSKTICVQASAPLNSEEEIQVLKNGSRVSGCKWTYSEDYQTIEITLPYAIQEKEYKIQIGELETSVAGEVAVVTDIVIDDRFKLNAASLSDKVTGGYVRYQILDQFGGDLTADTKVDVYSSMGAAAANIRTGLISVSEGTEGDSIFRNYQLGNKVVITLRLDDGTSATKECVMSDMSIAYDFSVSELYNAEGLALTDSFDGEDEFYILFDVKDQYGDVHNDLRDDMTKKVMDTLEVSMTACNTNLLIEENTNRAQNEKHAVFTNVEKEGKKYIGLKLEVETDTVAEQGTAILRMFGCSSYKMQQADIVVNYGTTVHTFSAEPLEAVVLGEDIEFDYTALDVNGEPVTDLASLKDLLKNEDRSLTDFGKDFKFVREGEQIKLYRKSDAYGNISVGYASTVVVTRTHQSAQIFYELLAKSRPTYIVGYHGKTVDTMPNNAVTFETRYFDFEDQYGRSMLIEDVYQYVNDFRIKIETNVEDFQEVSGDGTMTLSSSGSRSVTPSYTSGTKTVSFKLVSATGLDITDGVYNQHAANARFDNLSKCFTEASAYEMDMTVVPFNKIKEFEVSAVPLLYAGAAEGNAYAYDIEVYGISNSNKVLIPNEPEYYSVVLPTEADIAVTDGNKNVGLAYGTGTGKLYSVFNYGAGDDGADDFYVNGDIVSELKRKIEIVIGSKQTQVVRQEVTVSKEEPKVSKITLRYPSDYTQDVTKQGKVVDAQYKISASELNSDPSMTFLTCMDVTDQYGASTTGDKQTELDVSQLTPRFFINDIEVEQGSISTRLIKNNGTTKPSYSGFKAGDTFVLTYKFGDGVEASMDILVY